MNVKDALKTQYHLFYRTLNANLEGMTAEDSIKQPSPGGNCANWILAHTISAQNGVMGLVNEAPVLATPEIEAVGHDPITGPDRAVDWDTMVTNLLGSEERFMTGLDGLTDEQLDDEGFTDPFGNATTRGAFLSLMIVHQLYHGGQLGLSRRLAGHEGAVRPPVPQGAGA